MMKLVSTTRVLMALGAVTSLCLLALATLEGQAAQRPLLAEDVFKNVQVLKGIPVNDFMGTMGIFSAALGMSCEDCHRSGDSSWQNYATDSPRKQMARRMVVMMAAINKTNFGGRQAVTCFSCHRGSQRPQLMPSMTTLYGAQPLDDSGGIIEQARSAPSADAVFDKYIEAIGGASRVAALRSFTAAGTSVGYGPDGEQRPLEIFAQSPNRRTTVVRTPSGNSATTFDGTNGWIAAPHRPVPVLALAGADLDGFRLDTELSFPARIKQVAEKWRVGLPASIDDRDVQVVQGTGRGGVTANLYFDAESGLLVRQLRYVGSPVGPVPTQVDYADYREVSGVKMPFRWTVTWLDGRDTIELTEVQPNVPIDAARFARPPAP
jgi:photosynthetic reaction center cytochrome c subunit